MGAPLTLTKPHLRLLEILRSEGYDVVEEYPVSIYSLDCVDTDFWVGYEADGPEHGLMKKRDQIRDANIFDILRMPILRISSEDLMSKKTELEVRARINDFVDAWAFTAQERKNGANTTRT